MFKKWRVPCKTADNSAWYIFLPRTLTDQFESAPPYIYFSLIFPFFVHYFSLFCGRSSQFQNWTTGPPLVNPIRQGGDRGSDLKVSSYGKRASLASVAAFLDFLMRRMVFCLLTKKNGVLRRNVARLFPCNGRFFNSKLNFLSPNLNWMCFLTKICI